MVLPEVYIPLISALVGAVVATVGTVLTVLIQSKKEDRRDRRELAFRIASEQYAQHLEFAHKQNKGGGVYPLDLYMAHSLALVKAAEDGRLTPESLAKISSDTDALIQYIDAREAKRKEARQK